MQYCTTLALAGSLLLAGCAAPSSLQVIDNVLRHESPPPPAPPVVLELLARPLTAQDAAAIFGRSVPAALLRLAAPVPAVAGSRVKLHELLEPYLEDLAAAQRALQAAVPPLGELPAALPPPEKQREIATMLDPQALQRAAALFLEANARFAHAVRTARGRVTFPEGGARIVAGFGQVVIGTAGEDTYDLAPVRDGKVSVIIDPGGNDRYRGSDVVLHGLAAILDFGGNDRYESDGPGWGAAVAGVSLLLEVSGNEVYESGDFAQGAALAGLGALVDLEGDDTYRLRAFGQGLGLAGGTGLLWDRGGNDSYFASGLRDGFERGGALSFAQGAAVGVRSGVGGGIGLLRDDAGDDAYEAQMFAQGAGYYYGLGLLWDGAGNDRYRAVRYAQGNGVHQAVGVLRDKSGDDDYVLSVGVGQGMGLDLAVGALVDAAGDDRYAAGALAQGAATANGVGIVVDRGGRNEWRLDQRNGWGRAEWSRGLPSLGLVFADAPRVDAPVAHESEAEGACPAVLAATPNAKLTLAGALRKLGPGIVSGTVDAGVYALVQERLRSDLSSAIAELPAQDFDVSWPLATALRCALAGASESQARSMWDGFERLAATPYAGIIAGALRARPAPAAQMRRLVDRLSTHPSCGVRTAALSLDSSAAAAQAALQSTCWQLQARALRILGELGVAPQSLDGVPDFLRQVPSKAPRSASSARSTER